jgi:2-isopropylmalate synthase
MLKNAKTYEIMTPESVGLSKSSLPLGKLSGSNAFKAKLKELGFNLGDNALNDAFTRFKEVADKKRYILDTDILAIVRGQVGFKIDRIQLKNLQVNSSMKELPQAKVELIVDGLSRYGKMSTQGSIESVFSAIDLAYAEFSPRLTGFNVDAASEGADAQAVVTVQLQHNEYIANGQGSAHDTLKAAALAYVEALNRLLNLMEVGLTPGEAEAKASRAAI